MNKALKEAQIERDILKKGRKYVLQELQQIFRFMKVHQGKFAFERICKIFKVSRSAFYAWLNRRPTKRAFE